MTMTKQQYQQMLDRYDEQYDTLKAQYPGVRPSWVSGDLAEIGQSIMWCKAQIAEIEAAEMEEKLK